MPRLPRRRSKAGHPPTGRLSRALSYTDCGSSFFLDEIRSNEVECIGRDHWLVACAVAGRRILPPPGVLGVADSDAVARGSAAGGRTPTDWGRGSRAT